MSAGKVRQGGVFVEIGADAKAFFATLSRVNKSIGQAGKAMAMMGAKMTAVGTAITAPIAAASAAFASVGDQVQKMAARTGLSTEAVSGLGFAAEQSGTDMATLEKGVRTMQRSLDAAAAGGAAAGEAFKRLGLDVAALSQLSPEAQFTAIAEALSKVDDPGQRAALAMKVFGKAGASLVPLVSGGAAGIAALRAEAEQLGIVMDRDTADSAAALTDAMNAMNKAIRAVVVNVGGAVAPMFTKVAKVVSVLAADFSRFAKENGRFVQIALAVGAAVAGLGAALTTAGFAVMGMSAAMGALGGVLAALASPLALVVGGLAGLVVFGPQIASGLASAFGSVGGRIGQVANSLAGPLRVAVQDAAIVMNDLGATASTTFSGIYEAITSGDLSGAMDILWAGLQAGWLRGVEALMSYVDPFIAGIQNTFTYLATNVMNIWEGMNSGIAQGITTVAAVVMGIVDNIVNGVMASFDAMVSAVRKSWNWVQSFIVKGYDLAKENRKVDDEMSARAQQRAVSRPGLEGRMEQASQTRKEIRAQADRNIAANNAAAETAVSDRLGRNAERADERRNATAAAEGRLNELTSGARDRRIFRDQADAVTDSLGTATTMDAVRELAEEFHLLAATGALTESQIKAFAEAAETAQERIEEGRGAAASGPAPVDPEALRKAAMEAAASQAEVAGTFSAAAVGGMGVGQSLQQKQVDLLGKIEANTRDNEGGFVAD